MMWRVGTLVLVGATFGTIGAWLADREPPTEVHAVEVLTPVVRPGFDLRVKYQVRRRKACATTVERILYDSARTRHLLEDLDFKTAPGPLGPDTYVSTVHIPRSFLVGESQYRAMTTYRCNPIHSLWPITVLTADVRFDVVGP